MEKINLNRILRDLEIDYINKALIFAGYNITNASELLGLKRTTLTMKIKDLNISCIKVRIVKEQRPLRKNRPKLTPIIDPVYIKPIKKSIPNSHRPDIEVHKHLQFNPNNIEAELWKK